MRTELGEKIIATLNKAYKDYEVDFGDNDVIEVAEAMKVSQNVIKGALRKLASDGDISLWEINNDGVDEWSGTVLLLTEQSKVDVLQRREVLEQYKFALDVAKNTPKLHCQISQIEDRIQKITDGYPITTTDQVYPNYILLRQLKSDS